MNEQQQRFYRAITEMEQEGEAGPIDSSLEERLVRGALKEIGAQRTRRRWIATSAALALAAGLAVVMLRSTDDSVPGYQVQLSSTTRTLGSAPPDRRVSASLTLDSLLDVELRPQHAAAEAAQVRVFFRQDGRIRPWSIKMTPTAKGLFRLQAPVQALPAVHAGPAELIFAIGLSGGGPTVDELERALLHESPPRIKQWQVLRQPCAITPADSETGTGRPHEPALQTP